MVTLTTKDPGNAAALPSELGKLVAVIEKSVTNLDSSLKAFDRDVASTSTQDFTYPDGISLLTMKNDTMLDYLHHVVALSIWKISGRSLSGRDAPQTGTEGEQLVRNLVQLRVMLEKVRPLENRLRYQVDKLLRAAADADKDLISGRTRSDSVASIKVRKNGSNHQQRQGGDGRKDHDDAAADHHDDDDDGDDDEDDDDEDDLAFRPNLSSFGQRDQSRDGVVAKSEASKANILSSRKKDSRTSKDTHASSDSDDGGRTGVYRPPKLVPMAYDPDSRSSKKPGRETSNGGIIRNSALLSDLTAGMSSNPYEVSSGGVGVGGRLASQNSARAKALQRMEEFEEENFTRLVMSKKDAKKRRRDEADIALGGAGLSSGRDGRRRVGGGMEEEFGDLLRSSGLDGRKGKKAKRAEQAYDSLRSTSRLGSALHRSKTASPSFGSSSSASKSSKTNKFKSQVNRLSRQV